MGVVGGIIAYFVIREDDPKRAKSCLYLGIILSSIWFAIFVLPLIVGFAFLPHMPVMRHTNFV